jgi:hypothetical protein
MQTSIESGLDIHIMRVCFGLSNHVTEPAPMTVRIRHTF